LYNIQQYLHINRTQAKALLAVSVMNTPTPFTVREHMALIHALTQAPDKKPHIMNQNDIDATA
jgi:hypothetical protein